MTPHAAAPPRALPPPLLYGVLVAVLALAVAGGLLALSGAGGGGHAATAEAPSLPGTDENVRTSYGTMIVGRVAAPNGVTAKATSGVTHGINNLVTSESAQVEATVYLSNATNQTVEYSPTDFGLIATKQNGRRKTVRAVRSDVGPGAIQPRATLELRLGFVVPRDGSELLLSYHDPGAKTPIHIRLGRINAGAKDPGDGHNHNH